MRIPAKTADPDPGDADGPAGTLASGKLRPYLPGCRPLVIIEAPLVLAGFDITTGPDHAPDAHKQGKVAERP